MQIRNFGRKSLTEVREKLAALGLSLKGGIDRQPGRRRRRCRTGRPITNKWQAGSLSDQAGRSDRAFHSASCSALPWRISTMRHRRAQRKFGLPSDQRRALLKGLTRSMLLHDRIVTTEIRAKEVRPIVEKLVTMARKGGADAPVAMRLHTRRMVRRYVDSNVDEFVRVPGPRAEQDRA